MTGDLLHSLSTVGIKMPDGRSMVATMWDDSEPRTPEAAERLRRNLYRQAGWFDEQVAFIVRCGSSSERGRCDDDLVMSPDWDRPLFIGMDTGAGDVSAIAILAYQGHGR